MREVIADQDRFIRRLEERMRERRIVGVEFTQYGPDGRELNRMVQGIEVNGGGFFHTFKDGRAIKIVVRRQQR